MLVNDVVARVRSYVGDVNSIQQTDAQLWAWIDDAIKEIIIQNDLCQKTATQALVVGTDTYPLPTDIFKLYSIIVNGEKIKVYSLQEWEQLNAGYGAGPTPVGNNMPIQAYIWAGNLVLFPAPNSAFTMKVNYIYEPVPVAIGTFDLKTVIPDTYHLRLVTYLIAQYKLMDDDTNGYMAFMDQFRSGILDLKDQQIGESDVYASISVTPRDMGEELGNQYTW